MVNMLWNAFDNIEDMKGYNTKNIYTDSIGALEKIMDLCNKEKGNVKQKWDTIKPFFDLLLLCIKLQAIIQCDDYTTKVEIKKLTLLK